MLTRVQGIVVGTVNYGETSLICKIYTLQYGLRTYMVNGVRKSKSKWPLGYFQLMSQLDMEIYHRPEKEINRVRDIQTHKIYKRIYFEPKRAALGQFITELLRNAIRGEEPDPNLYEFVSHTLNHLDSGEIGVEILLDFMFECTKLLGFSPTTGSNPEQYSYFDLRTGSYRKEKPTHPDYLIGLDEQIFTTVIQGETAKLSLIEKEKALNAWVFYYQLHLPSFKVSKTLPTIRYMFF